MSSRMVDFFAARGIHYGWIVAGTTFLIMLATAGAMGAAGVLIVPLEQEFGWSNAAISTAFAIRILLFGLLGPFAAAFMNRFGIRAVTVTALTLIAAGVGGSLAVTEHWQLVLLWGVVVGIGTGLTALVLGATVAVRWFEQRRGLVVGLMTASNATGQLVFLPLLAGIAETIGWRYALATVVAALSVALALALVFLRDRPADIGLTPFGAGTNPPVPPRTRLGQLLATPVRVLIESARTPVFWALFLTFVVCGFSTNGLIQTHWISICGDYGIAATGAAGLLAVVGAFDLVGTIVSGWLSDRYDNRWLLFWFYGLRGLSLIFLPLSDFSFYALSMFAVFYGLDWVATVPPTVKLTAARFGPERAPIVFGWVFTGHQVGAASAAIFAGAARTAFETYLPAMLTAGVFCILAALLILTVERDRTAFPAPRPA
ncbi:MAG: MFS transporter [Bauldia sp.]|nr:MFS transporter [Bauldia sp.]